MKLIIRLVINAAAIWAASYLVDGISLDTHNIIGVIIVAAVFGVVNALIKPVVKFFSFPFIIVTLGLFTLVINAGLLWLTGALTSALTVQGFVPALLGALVVGLVSWGLSLFVDDDDDD